MFDKLIKSSGKSTLGSDTYRVIHFENYENHFVGLDDVNNIALLIDSDNPKSKDYVNFKGKNLQILFDKESTINIDGHISKGTFTVLHLISDNDNVKKYFIEICKLLLKNIGGKPSIEIVNEEVEYVKEIFLNLNKSRIKEEIGLWGELFLIYIQKNKAAAISAWHSNSRDRIDFNNGKIKIEIKTTLSNDRKHIFKLNQLRNHYKEEVLVCSIMTYPIDDGITIKEIIDQINQEINSDDKIKLNKKVSSSLGEDLFSLSFKRFDEKSAFDSLSFYNSVDIPSIELDTKPIEVTKVQFTSNLNKVPVVESIKKTDLF